MKENFGLVKKSWGYDINSIDDQGVRFTMHILAGKIMRNCKAKEVLAIVISLAAQCSPGVQINWDTYLCEEFFTDFREARKQGKTFHYT